MEVEFDLTPLDVEALQRYHAERRRASQRPEALPGWAKWVIWDLLVLLGIGSLALGAAYPDVARAAYRSLFLAFLVAAVAGCFLAILRWFSRASGDHCPPNWHLIGPRRYSITPEGFASESASRQAFERWADILDIVTTAQHAFFYTCAGQVYILSRRAFPDSQQFETFLALARRNKQGPPTSTAITAAPPRPTTITSAPE